MTEVTSEMPLAAAGETRAGENRGAQRRRPLLQVERLTKLFPVSDGLFGTRRHVHAVDHVTLYVRHGETLGLVGESGCGKTTLGRTLLRLIEPTFGRIVFDGKDIGPLSQRQIRPLRRHMQMVFQDPYASLDPRMTVRETVAEGIQVHRLAGSRAEIGAMTALMLSKVGLGVDMMSRYPHELSAGERQRVAIARALAVQPSFVVCDEPVSALDVSIQAQILNLLRELQEASRVSFLFISHDLRVIRHVSHRIAVMYCGGIVEVAPSAHLFTQPAHPYTRALLSAMPVPDPTRRAAQILLEGDAPDPLDPPSGCAFHPRCPRSDRSACVHTTPSLQETSPGDHHRVACWHPHEESLIRLPGQ